MPEQQPPTTKLSWLARLKGVVRGLGPAGPLLVFAGGGPLVGFFVFTATHESWLPLFGDDVASMLAFWGAASLLAGLCLIPTQVTSLLAGFLFGVGPGTALAFASATVAALVGLKLWSRIVGDRVLGAIARSEEAERVHRALLGRSPWRTTWLIALLRLSPVMPFAATNLLMASFGVRTRVFLAATLLGVAPRLVAVTMVGAELSEFDWQSGTNKWTMVLALAATVLVLFLISRIARNALRRETSR